MTALSLRRFRWPFGQCQSCLYLSLAFLCGMFLPIHASSNAQLARSLGSVPLAADVSYLVGFLVLMGFLATGKPGQIQWSAIGQAPRWSLIGGLMGACYVMASAYFTSLLGPTLTLGFIVCGQTIAGLMTDHFGWLGVNRRRLTPHRQVALGLLIVAIWFLAHP